MLTRRSALLIVAVVLALIVPTAALAGNGNQANNQSGDSIAEVTLLHTNDFHGRLETDYKGRGGSAYMASIIDDIRMDVGEENVALLSAGDAFFAAPAISQLLMGESTIDIYNMMGYDLAAFGNHEFDKGQSILIDRVNQSEFPWLGANVVVKDGDPWELPWWASPYEILDIGGIKLGVLGLAGEETPEVTMKGTTAGLEFKDLTETILHYQDEILAQADAMIVVAHMGTADSGPYDGLVTVAEKLNALDKPVDLMIGGHQHEAIFEPVMVGDTAIVCAGYYGRWVGQIDLTIDTVKKSATIANYELRSVIRVATFEEIGESLEEMYEDGLVTNTGLYNSLVKKYDGAAKALASGKTSAAEGKLRGLANELTAQAGKKIDADAAEKLARDIEGYITRPQADPDVEAQVANWAEIVAPIVDQPVGYTTIDLIRIYNDESNMGDIVTDSMLWKADELDEPLVSGSVDIAFTNPGGLRENILIPDDAPPEPYMVTWGDTFDVLPFGNLLFLMDLTGQQVQDLLDQSARLYKGILQTSGASYEWFNDDVASDDPDPTVWGAQNVMVGGVPLDLEATYRVVTNDFLAGGQDGWVTFEFGTARDNTYYDMQAGFVEYIKALDDNTIDAEDIVMGRITYIP